MHICPICQDNVNNDYAIINGELEIYHIGCIQTWFTNHNTGIMTQNIITSYDMYLDGHYETTISIDKSTGTNIPLYEHENRPEVNCGGMCEVFFLMFFIGCCGVVMLLIYLKTK